MYTAQGAITLFWVNTKRKTVMTLIRIVLLSNGCAVITLFRINLKRVKVKSDLDPMAKNTLHILHMKRRCSAKILIELKLGKQNFGLTLP